MLSTHLPTEGPALISYAALQHGFHFTFYSFRASAAHMLSPYPLSPEQMSCYLLPPDRVSTLKP
jgi:hypothetical protein